MVRRAGERGGLDEVPVDGPDVRAVPGRQVADRSPLGEQPAPQAGAVERFDDVDERAPGAQQRQQLGERRPRPGLAQLRRGVGEVVQGAGGDRQPGAGGGRGDAQHQRRVAGGRGVAGQRHLPQVFDDPRGQRPAHRWAAQRGQAAARQSGAGRAQTDLGGERDRACGPGQGPGQVEPVADLQHRGHLVGVLGAEHVAGAPGEAVQLGADVEQQVARLQHLTAGAVEQLGRGERVDQVHVAQPAVAVLQVGLDAVGDLPHLGPAVAGGVGELVEPAPDTRAPGLPDGAADGVGQRLVAGDVPGLEQPQRGPQVRRGHLDGLARGAHGVVEPDAGVPQRVPHLLGEPLDVLAAVVQQHEVEVGVRRELAPAQGAHGDQGGAVGEADGLGVRGEPEVVQVDQCRAQRRRAEPAPATRLGQQHGLGPHEVLRGRRRHRPRARYRIRRTHSASAPRSPVRTRTTVSTGVTHTLPSPILPVRAAFTTASTTRSTAASSTITSTRTLGTNSTW